MPQLVGAGDPEMTGSAATMKRAVALQELLGAHHPLGALAVDRRADLSGRERGDHPGAVGRFSRATATIASSTAPATARGPGPVLRLGVR